MDYASLEDFKLYLRLVDTQDDDVLQLALTAASRAIDNHTGRTFDSATEDRTFDVVNGVCLIDDLVELDEIDTEDSYVLYPRNGTPKTRIIFTDGAPSEVTITGDWGWADVPDAVKQATLLQASRFVARRDAPFGVAGSPEAGTEIRLLAKVDPDVAVTLDGYRRKWWAV